MVGVLEIKTPIVAVCNCDTIISECIIQITEQVKQKESQVLGMVYGLKV